MLTCEIMFAGLHSCHNITTPADWEKGTAGGNATRATPLLVLCFISLANTFLVGASHEMHQGFSVLRLCLCASA